MREPKSIVSYKINEYGHVKVKLAKLLDEQGITRNKLASLIGVKYSIVDRYYRSDHIEFVDLGFVAKVCYSLGCKIDDLLEYVEPDEKKE